MDSYDHEAGETRHDSSPSGPRANSSRLEISSGTDSSQLFHLGRCPADYSTLRDRIKAFETNARSAYKAMKRLEHALALDEKLHPHRLRKSFATFAKRLKLDPQYAQKVTGHEEIEMLLDVYTHVDDEEAKRAFSKISFMHTAEAPGSSTEGAVELLQRVIAQLEPEARSLVGPILSAVIKMLEGL